MNAGSGTAWWIRGLRVAFGVLGVVALVWIPVRNLDVETFSTANYFSYFTIQSNVVGVVVLLIGGLRDPLAQRWQVIRGAATLYLMITGVVYAVLLADIDVMLTDKWINDILHRVLPIVLVLDWLAAPAALAITGKLIGGWLIYPVVYGAYTLIRGPIVDWYPYPFIDPREQGYVSLTIGLIVLTGVFALLAVAVAAVGNLAGRWRERSPAP
ncbi:Pr6Pr family membrane protein [Nocardia puris]|uniref:Pr6Pr family membrane protein n=1 Tax=Nocardia puris TaxID=208602 RepID=UPI001894E2C3|nr:Pr6Pr family membrane protein [Nocardia puris]MBF6212701.1 Pr6Pr family membrane protein [Nocardia puris]MBF6367639.1 Pr6Pr family membrane protein [Nocardia puris]MBF6461290.1 Pr6Pr family membrane protein [Nocardia puris]